MKHVLAFGLVVGGLIYYIVSQKNSALPQKPKDEVVQVVETKKEVPPSKVQSLPKPVAPRKSEAQASTKKFTISTTPQSQEKEATREPHQPPSGTLSYVIEDGLAVTQGDIVLGAAPDGDQSGLAHEPGVKLWPSSVIAYHIQPHLENPERIEAALELFRETVIQFVPYDGSQEHAIIFEVGSKNCKSYVGHIGGHQPIWLAHGCTPEDIVHEILHALGFVHEQNRWDRDQYVKVHYENILEEHYVNFEKFSPEMMLLSGMGPFDFRSLMIYPPTMFARGGHKTMEPAEGFELIEPSRGLSPTDIQRVNKAYGQ